ncbi:MAG: signal peptidase I [Wenzhouxiangella sp.]|nr:signal peptidase I [Wenzhouxiangella sp.]MCH8478002.1 signal peptidase I [Wenzhouxiangella sp.]TVR97590.1 MAG: signal peptidase I [Wenzhouxiangellaceae bacterium]
MDYALILTVLTLACGILWAIDHVRRRRRPQGIEDGLAGRTIELAGSIFPVLLLVLIIRSFVFEPFKIPSGSMIPTLLIGDFIVVNKFSYGLRLPVVNKRIVSLGDPERGDVMVFRFPEDTRVNYIKRVIGLPGDTITYRNKILFVNGEPIVQDQQGLWEGEGRNRNLPGRRPQLRQEFLGEDPHNILVHPDQPARQTQTWVVPEGHYFVLGDNRDHSLDSRAWGFVPEENLVGRATRIWMHWDCSRGCIDFRRIGDKII